MWPIAVAGVGFTCLLTASTVRPGHVVKCPFLIAWTRSYFVQLNIALCR
jgi:hypothetical protein